MNYDTIIVSKEQALGVITLNRPEALNALNTKMVNELIDALGGFEKDDLVRCVVIAGSESAFSAGADIKEMVEMSDGPLLSPLGRGGEVPETGCRGSQWFRLRRRAGAGHEL